MKTFLVCYLIAIGVVMGTFIVETYVDNLPEESKFRKWWRQNVVGEAPSDLDF